MSERQKAKLRDLVDELAPDFIQVVAEIESKPATTKGHYGKYLAFLQNLEEFPAFNAKPGAGPVVARAFVAMLLIRAGGNEEGIREALAFIHPEIREELF